jgi:hypothetical protein
MERAGKEVIRHDAERIRGDRTESEIELIILTYKDAKLVVNHEAAGKLAI